jgi:DNA processing protein
VEHGRPVILTDMVIERNEWARVLLGRSGVHRASRLREVTAVVERLISERADVGAELQRLGSV